MDSRLWRSVRQAALTSILFLLVMALLDVFFEVRWPPALIAIPAAGLIEFFKGRKPVEPVPARSHK